jgi:hypothetical protein
MTNWALILSLFAAVLSASAYGSSGAFSNSAKILGGKFKILSVAPSKAHCRRDDTKEESRPSFELPTCTFKLETISGTNEKVPKFFEIEVGKKGCSFKSGEIVELKLSTQSNCLRPTLIPHCKGNPPKLVATDVAKLSEFLMGCMSGTEFRAYDMHVSDSK